MNWVAFALLSALAASATAILAKIGVRDVPSNVATAVRAAVILVFASGVVVATREHRALDSMSRRSFVFLVLSGLATGVSWLAYFKALQLGPVSRVAPVDKVSLPLTIVLATVFLGEPLSWRVGLGAALMVGGALLTIST